MGVSEAMTWTIYTFGDGDLIAQLLQAVALLVNGGLGSLIKAAAMAGLIAVLGLASIGAIDWSRIVGWFVGFVLVFVALVQIRTAVAVEDVVDARIPAQVVADVPLAFALPAAVASEVGYRLSDLATALQLNGEMGNGLQMLRPTADLQALLEASLAPGDLRANLINYLHVCVVPEGSGISPVSASRAADLASFIESDDVATTMPIIMNGQESGAMTCMDVYHQVLLPQFTIPPVISGIADDGLRETVKQLACRVTGGRQLVTGAATINPCADPPSPWDELTSALQAVRMDLATPQQAFWTVVIAKLWPEAELDLARERMDSAAATAIANDGLLKQLEIQAKTGQQIGKSGLLRQIRALADGFVYLGAPLLLALSVTPFVWKGLGLYLRLFVWLAFWGPLQVIANFVILGVSTSDLTAAGTAITMGNLQQLFTQVVQANAMGYETLIAVPGIALALAWGSVSAVGGLLSGTGAGIQRMGEDVRRRVESGEQVLASSMRAPLIEGDFLRRPPNIYDTPTSAFQKGWGSHAVTWGIGGSSITLPDGRQITTRNDGSARIVSPTQEVSITPEGYKTGWQLLDQEVTVRTKEGTYRLQKGELVQWRGNSVEVNLSSQKDQLTHQQVAPRGVFTQDPHAPEGFGPLVHKSWEVVQNGLTIRATQGQDGRIVYAIDGRTDILVKHPNGETEYTPADVTGRVIFSPDGRGGYDAGPLQATARYLSQDGQRHNEEGVLFLNQSFTQQQLLDRFGRFFSENNPLRKRWEERPEKSVNLPLFQPITGDNSGVVRNQTVQPVEINGAPGTLETQTMQGADGVRYTKATVALQDGRRLEMLIPEQPDAQGPQAVPVTMSGTLPITLHGAGLPPGLDGREVRAPLNQVVGTVLVAPEAIRDPEQLAEALSSTQWQPTKIEVVDPQNPQQVLTVEGALAPPGTVPQSTKVSDPSGRTVPPPKESATPPEGVDVVVPEVSVEERPQPRTGWGLEVQTARTETSAPVALQPAPGMGLGEGGHFEVIGLSTVAGQSFHDRFAQIVWVTKTGQRVLLGAGAVSARRDQQTGQWVVTDLKGDQGMQLANRNGLHVDSDRDAGRAACARGGGCQSADGTVGDAEGDDRRDAAESPGDQSRIQDGAGNSRGRRRHCPSQRRTGRVRRSCNVQSPGQRDGADLPRRARVRPGEAARGRVQERRRGVPERRRASDDRCQCLDHADAGQPASVLQAERQSGWESCRDARSQWSDVDGGGEGWGYAHGRAECGRAEAEHLPAPARDLSDRSANHGASRHGQAADAGCGPARCSRSIAHHKKSGAGQGARGLLRAAAQQEGGRLRASVIQI